MTAVTTTAAPASAGGPAPSAPAGGPATEGAARDRDALYARLLGNRQPASTPLGWAAVFAVTFVAGLLRFWRLDQPHRLVFDETYYVKQGVSYLKSGYELRWNGNATASVDARFRSGDTNVFLDEPDFVVHPPVGKWMIAAGEWIFGPASSWGWRFSVALCGTLSILMIVLIVRHLLRSTLLGVVAGLLLAVDGHHFVLSRTGLLDIFVMFWALAAFGCLLLDRDQSRRRLADAVAAGASLSRFGPGSGIRWWRLAAGVCLGLCIGTKWSGLYFLAVFGLMTVLWDLGANRAAGVRRWFTATLLRDAPLGALLMLPVAFAVYLASWTGWLLSSSGYDRRWAVQNPGQGAQWLPEALRSLWHYHEQMYHFHVTLETSHPYMANPWSWIVMGRPTAFDYIAPKRGELGCKVEQCSQAITALGNPVIWWGGTLAVAVLVFQWALRRDWRAGAILAGMVAGYVPWFFFQDRTVYNFYSVAFVPWVVMGLTYVLGMMLGRPDAEEGRRRTGAIAAGAVVLAAVLAFWFFLPVLSAEVIPQTSWSDRMWLASWI
jgi:dolichyl-phosphate-mannose-protein mannosyltransferase